MTRFLCALALYLSAAVPAHATGGFVCRALDNDLTLAAVMGRGVVPALVSVRLSHDGEVRASVGDDASLVIAQSWVDDRNILLDIVNADASAYVARLRVNREGETNPLYGTLWLEDSHHPVGCEMDG